MAERIDQHSLSWADLRGLLAKHRLVILIVFLSVVAGAWATLQILYTDRYETKATLLVKLGRENAEVPASVQNGQLLSQGVRIADINSEVEMLSSLEHVEAVVDQVGPDAFKSVLIEPQSKWGYPKYYLKRTARWAKDQWKEFLIATSLKKRLTPREEAILFLADGLKVEPIKESDVLTMKLRLPSAKLAVDCANAILNHYLQRRFEIRKNTVGTRFFAEQMGDSQARLRAFDAQRASVRETFGLSSPSEQRSNLLKQLSALRTQISDVDAEIGLLDKEREVIAGSLSVGPELRKKEEVSAQNPAIPSIKERVTSLKLERAKVANRYQPESEVVQKLDREIRETETLLSREQPTILATVTAEANPVLGSLAKDLAEKNFTVEGLRRQRSLLSDTAQQIQAELAQLNRGSDAFETADRDYRIAEQAYLLYVKKLQEAKLSEELDGQRVTNVSVVAPPETPIEPVYPPKMFVMGVSLPVGLLLGIVLAALLESLEDRIRGPKDLAGFEDLELLGSYRLRKEVSPILERFPRTVGSGRQL